MQHSFQPTWFSQWSFLHYDEAKDVVLCHTCLRGFESKRIKAAKANSAFVSNFKHIKIIINENISNIIPISLLILDYTGVL